jgi:hypothetical protein
MVKKKQETDRIIMWGSLFQGQWRRQASQIVPLESKAAIFVNVCHHNHSR